MSKPLTILSVDDDAMYTRLIERVLRTADLTCQLIFAADGFEAIEKFDALHPDIIILDVNLPGKDGYEVCRHIRRVSKAGIIAMSGDILSKEKSLEAGATQFISKPFSRMSLLAALAGVGHL